MINEETFASRLTSLREQKKVSAREMSLDLGQNGSYINRIENRKAFLHIPLKLCTRSKSTDQCSGINCLNGLDKYVSAEQLFVLLDYP